MVNWLRELTVWLYNHPYEHDQRAMSAFLNYTEKVSFPKRDKKPTERVAGLDYNDIESSRIPYYNYDWAPPDIPEWSVFD